MSRSRVVSWRRAQSAASVAPRTTLGILISLAPVGALLWHRQLPQAHDFFRNLVLAAFFSDAISEGVWYPRWLPDMNGGYGYPEFVFYPPGYFFLSQLFALVGMPILRCALTLAVVSLVGGLGAYRLIRCFMPPRPSLFFLLLFQLTPYHFTEIYGLGHLSESMALQLSPWPLYFLCRLARTPGDGRAHRWLGVGLALALTGMGYAHPLTYVLFLPVFVAMACGVGLSIGPRARGVFFRRTSLGILLALTLSSPYWLTVVTMRPYVNSQAALGGRLDPFRHFLSPVAFFWSGGDALSRQLGLSFELGPVHFILALAGVWVGRREPIVLAASVIYGTLLLLMTRALSPFWSLYPFYLMQFPWRLLAVSAVFQLISMLGLARFTRDVARKRVAIALALVGLTVMWHRDQLVFRAMPRNAMEAPTIQRMISDSFPERSTFAPIDVVTPGAGDIRNAMANVRHAVPLTRIATLDGSEWMPITALGSPLPRARSESLLEIQTGSASVVPKEGSSKFRLDYVVDGATTSVLVINQLYLPGWRVLLDGSAVSEGALRDTVLSDGRIAVSIGPGRHRLEAWYDGPPGRRWRLLAMLAVGGGCVVLLLWPRRKATVSSSPTPR